MAAATANAKAYPPQPLRPARANWLGRLLGVDGGHAASAPAVVAQRLPSDICIEVRRGESTVTVLWPAQSANECAAWLREYLQ
jgi:hypothetical protein